MDLRLDALRARLAGSLWFLPAVGVVVASVSALLLSQIGAGDPFVEAGGLGFGGTPEGARAVLSTVAGAIITVTSVTFSLTVVALQMASSQFSPRILRTFLSDRGNQVVLATFLSTFAFALVTLRSIRSGSDGDGGAIPFVPDWAVGGTLVLTALSVAMLVFFVHHLTQQLRVESILQDLQRHALNTVRGHLPSQQDVDLDLRLPEVPDGAVTLRARRSGYLQSVHAERLMASALEAGVVFRVRPRIGGPVTEGATLAWAWPVEAETQVAASSLEDLNDKLTRSLLVGFERTMQQDVGFGLRQLVDIAVRALSPGINDPATAVATIGAIAPVMAELTRRRTGHDVRLDDEGRVRVAIDEPTFGELLALACDQPRRYASTEPAVHIALLEMLGDLAELDSPDAEALQRQVDLTVASCRDMPDHEVVRVRAAAQRAVATLDLGDRVAEDSDEAIEEPAG